MKLLIHIRMILCWICFAFPLNAFATVFNINTPVVTTLNTNLFDTVNVNGNSYFIGNGASQACILNAFAVNLDGGGGQQTITITNDRVILGSLFGLNLTFSNAALIQLGGGAAVQMYGGSLNINGQTNGGLLGTYPPIYGRVEVYGWGGNPNPSLTINMGGSGRFGDSLAIQGDINAVNGFSTSLLTLNMNTNQWIAGNIGGSWTTANITMAANRAGYVSGNVFANTLNLTTYSGSTGAIGSTNANNATINLGGSGNIGSVAIGNQLVLNMSNSGGVTGNVSSGGSGAVSISSGGRINGNFTGGANSSVNISSSGGINGNVTMNNNSSATLGSSGNIGGFLRINGTGNLTITNTSAGGNRVGAVTITGAANVQMNGAGSIGGDLSVGASSTVNFTSSGFVNGNFSSGANSNLTMNGNNISGTIGMTSNGTLTTTNNWTPNPTNITGVATFNVRGGTTTLNSTMNLPTALTISPVVLNATTTLNIAAPNGSVTGTANTTIAGNGTGNGILNINTNNGLATTGTLTLNTGAIINANQNWTKNNIITANAGVIRIANGKTFTNTGALNVNTGFTMTDGTAQTNGSYTNSGSLSYGSTNPTAFSFTGTFTNSAAFGVNQSFTANMPFVNNNNSTITIAAARTLALNGATTFTNGAISGAGNLSIGSGVTFAFQNGTIDNTGTRTNNGTFTQTGGTISGASNFTNAAGATFNFNGGSITSVFVNQAASSRLIIGASLSLADTTSNAGTLTINSGTTTTGTFTNIGSFTNNSTYNLNGVFTNSGVGSSLINANQMTANATLQNAGTFSNTGTATFNAAITGTGIVDNTGTLVFNNSSNISGQTFNNKTNGIIIVNGTGQISNVINAAGSSGYTNNQLIFGRSQTGAFVVGNNVTDVRTISVESGTLQVNGQITGVNTAFNVAAGTTATFANTLSGSGVINNFGTINFNAGSTVNNFSAINMASNSLLSFNNGVKTINLTNIVGAVGNTGSQVYIGPSAATVVQTTGTIQDIRLISIFTGSTLRLNSGGKITSTNGSNAITIDGTLDIDPGAFLTVNPSDQITGNGNVINGGLFTVNGANLTLGGNFTNESNGVFKILGVPTITFSGPSFINDGELNVSFNTSNSLPFINLVNATGVDLSKGNIIVGYQRNYIASGDYVLLTAASPPTIGGYMTPPASKYIKSINLQISGNSVVVDVERIGFGFYALTEKAQQIGNFLEFIGSNNPSQAQLDLLNALEKIDNNQILTDALESLLPPDYTQQINLQMQQALMGAIFLRLAHQRMVAEYGSIADMGFASGDEDPENAVWIRPFYNSGHQRNFGSQVGYTSKTNGVILGFDKQITAPFMLGAAVNYANSNATNSSNAATKTNIKSYQATIYGTYKYPKSVYVDALVSAGVNNYKGTRNIFLPGYNQNAYSSFQTQQFTTKAMVSREIALTNYLQFTPQASAQYSFIRQLAYTETGAGPYDIYTNPDNTNLFRLGTGAKFGIPMSEGKMLSIPSIYALAFVDVAGGGQDTNSQFVSGGPIISSSIQPGRLMLVFGGSYEFSLSDNIQIIANYDVEIRNGFTGQEAFLNLRYLF